jgi:hypothetical protein
MSYLRSRAADAHANLSFSPYVGTGRQNVSELSEVFSVLPILNCEEALDSANSMSLLEDAVVKYMKP